MTVLRGPETALVSMVADAEDLVGLLSDVARGSQLAFAELYDIISPSIFGFVLEIVASRARASELTLEIFLRIWREAPHYDPDRAAPGTWVLSIALRYAVEHHRAASIRPPLR